MRWQTNMRWIGLACGVLLLAACSSNETKPGNAADKEPAATTTASASVAKDGNGTPGKSVATPVQPAPVIPNPAIVPFEKMSVVLDDKGKQIVAQIADRAKKSHKVTATGFCDKRQIGNPADAAVTRAVVVRDELIRLGVAPANVQVRFITKVMNKHAVEVQFD